MKRLAKLLLVAALLFTTTQPAQSADIKVSGLWQHRVSFANRTFGKGMKDEIFRSASRLRTQIDIIATEALKGVVFFEIGHQNWGVASQGASLGTDGKVLKVRYSYVDWLIPSTDIKVRVGLQGYALPTFTGIGYPILFADGAGITVSEKFNDNLSGTLFWMRAENDNDVNTTGKNSKDSMDFVGMTLPVSVDGFKVTPWAMYGRAGRDSFTGSDDGVTYARVGMLPLLGTASLVSASESAYGNIWYAGVAAEMTAFSPFKLSFDGAWGSVDMGTSTLNNHSYDVKRSGWFTAVTAEYMLDIGTPGLTFWYSSGDNGNMYDGSERLPTIFPDVTATSYGFDGTNYGGAAQVFGFGISGTWAVMAQMKNISYFENLSHTVRGVYYGGTNSADMVRNGAIKNPQATLASMIYLTEKDRAFEFNFDTEYKLYKNLSLFVELGYIRLDLDENLWKSVGYEAKKNNLKGALSIKYSF